MWCHTYWQNQYAWTWSWYKWDKSALWVKKNPHIIFLKLRLYRGLSFLYIFYFALSEYEQSYYAACSIYNKSFPIIFFVQSISQPLHAHLFCNHHTLGQLGIHTTPAKSRGVRLVDLLQWSPPDYALFLLVLMEEVSYFFTRRNACSNLSFIYCLLSFSRLGCFSCKHVLVCAWCKYNVVPDRCTLVVMYD